MNAASATHLLDVARVQFLAQPVSITVGSSDAERIPSLARALGCRVTSDRRSITVFLAVARAPQLLRDLRAERNRSDPPIGFAPD
jgi:hypothetical protein